MDAPTSNFSPPPPPAYPPADVTYPPPPVAPPPGAPAPPALDEPEGKSRRLLTVFLVLVIVVSLVIAGVIGAEIYARHRADTLVAGVVKCVVQDDAEVSFGATPFLLQHFSSHYSDLSITTAGNQIRDAQGMKLQLDIDDIRLDETADSAGTIGSLTANITWSSAGIQNTLKNVIPFVGSMVSGVTTNPDAGTIEIDAGLGTIVAKPQVVNSGLQLQVVDLTGLGFMLPSEVVQPALDAFTATLTQNYPMGIQAQSVQVTDEGVISTFGAQNATIPRSGDDPCFAGL